jgi:hypothetical protein
MAQRDRWSLWHDGRAFGAVLVNLPVCCVRVCARVCIAWHRSCAAQLAARKAEWHAFPEVGFGLLGRREAGLFDACVSHDTELALELDWHREMRAIGLCSPRRLCCARLSAFGAHDAQQQRLEAILAEALADAALSCESEDENASAPVLQVPDE